MSVRLEELYIVVADTRGSLSRAIDSNYDRVLQHYMTTALTLTLQINIASYPQTAVWGSRAV